MEFNATFLVSAISFIIFVFVMNAIFYKPLEKIVDERKKFVDGNYHEAESHKTRAKKLVKDKEDKLNKASADAKKIMVEKTDLSKAQKETMTTESRQKATDNISQAKEELNKSTQDATQALTSQVVDLAQNISSKILGENIQIENVNNDLINDIMQKG